MKILLKDVKLVVRMGKYRGEEINTSRYLAQARDHSYVFIPPQPRSIFEIV